SSRRSREARSRSSSTASPTPISTTTAPTGPTRRTEGCDVHIDISVLHHLEREKDITFEVLVAAIEQALLSAYHRTPGAHERARVELDRDSGDVTVWAVSEEDEEAGAAVEFDHTPEGFGRVATATARQVI